MMNTRTESNSGWKLAKLFKEIAEVITTVSRDINQKFFTFSEYKYLFAFICFKSSIRFTIIHRDNHLYMSKEGHCFFFFSSFLLIFSDRPSKTFLNKMMFVFYRSFNLSHFRNGNTGVCFQCQSIRASSRVKHSSKQLKLSTIPAEEILVQISYYTVSFRRFKRLFCLLLQ